MNSVTKYNLNLSINITVRDYLLLKWVMSKMYFVTWSAADTDRYFFYENKHFCMAGCHCALQQGIDS